MKRTLVAVTVALAGLAIMLTGCPTTTDPNNGKENGNNGGQEIPDLPRDQTAQINLPGEHTGTVQGHMTNAEWEGVAERIAAAIQTRFDEAPDFAQNMLKEVFSRPQGLAVVAETEPEFEKWKTNGDGRTVHINLALGERDLEIQIVEAITAAWANRNAIDDFEVTAEVTVITRDGVTFTIPAGLRQSQVDAISAIVNALDVTGFSGYVTNVSFASVGNRIIQLVGTGADTMATITLPLNATAEQIAEAFAEAQGRRDGVSHEKPLA